MNNLELKTRDKINNEYKWDIEAMYPDESKWDKDIEDSLAMSSEFTTLKGHILDSAESLLKALELYSDTFRLVENAFVYSRMRRDEDNTNSKYVEMNNKAMSAISQVSAALSFFTPELLASTEEKVLGFIEKEPRLKMYEFMLKSTLQKKAHILSTEEENILATLGEVLDAPHEIFSMLNDADMVFGKITDDNGNEVELTHGNYTQLMESENREIRKTAFEMMYKEYQKLNNTISVMYNYNVKQDVIEAHLRKYNSALESELSSENIPLDVYDNLIEAVHKNLPAMHKYVSIRKRVLGVDDLKMYDVYRPLVKPAGLECSYEEAVEIACKALAPLGEEYVSVLRKGLTEDKWVDIYENKGKTSGAYSFGAYDSKPYILMNYSGDLRDVFTLVHEGGHSMHSYYTRKEMPYIYGSHSIFTAEVASTVNETLLINYLLDIVESDEMKIYLINFYIDEFKSTLFRQTMFAEFEKIAHDIVEDGGSLTAELMNDKYNELNTMYFGPNMGSDDYIKYEWSRIPHFYRSFYVYQYATGYSAANALANAILTGDEQARDNYLKFLTLGDSDDPIELLKVAGVDMSTEEPVLSALSTFSRLVDELDELI